MSEEIYLILIYPITSYYYYYYYYFFFFQTSQHTTDIGSIQKGADFVKAFMLGFEIDVSKKESY